MMTRYTMTCMCTISFMFMFVYAVESVTTEEHCAEKVYTYMCIYTSVKHFSCKMLKEDVGSINPAKERMMDNNNMHSCILTCLHLFHCFCAHMGPNPKESLAWGLCKFSIHIVVWEDTRIKYFHTHKRKEPFHMVYPISIWHFYLRLTCVSAHPYI